MTTSRVLGTSAAASHAGDDDDDGDSFLRRRWPFLAGGVGALVVITGIVAFVMTRPASIDDDISTRNAKEIARLMEAQLDTELAILGAR